MSKEESTFTALRPRAIDTITAEAHGRRRHEDLAQAMRSSVITRRRRVRPTLMLAGTAGIAAAAVAVTVLAAPGDRVTPGEGTTAVVPQENVLLAAATAAEKERVTGRYLYTRERTTKIVDQDITKIAKKFEKKVFKPVAPFTAKVSVTQDSWWASDPHDPQRTVMNLDPEIGFPSPADEANWRKAGSLDLVQAVTGVPGTVRGQVNDYEGLSEDIIRARRPMDRGAFTYPTTQDKLDRFLHANWSREVRDGRTTDSYPVFLFGTAQNALLDARPGTRAALFRLLAAEPGIRVEGDTVRALGPDPIVLTIDRTTGRVARQDSYLTGKTEPVLTVEYRTIRWVDTLGHRN